MKIVKKTANTINNIRKIAKPLAKGTIKRSLIFSRLVKWSFFIKSPLF